MKEKTKLRLIFITIGLSLIMMTGIFGHVIVHENPASTNLVTYDTLDFIFLMLCISGVLMTLNSVLLITGDVIKSK